MKRTKAESQVPDAVAMPAELRGKKDPSLEYRHIELFRHAYRLCSQHGKGIDRDMVKGASTTALDRIKSSFGCAPFVESDPHLMVPSPFGERLFNDTKALELSMFSLISRVAALREQLPLRIGINQAIFRTEVFGRIYQLLDKIDGFSSSCHLIRETAAASMLEQCDCDIYIGFGTGSGDRLVIEPIAELPMRRYVRRPEILQAEDASLPVASAINRSGWQFQVPLGTEQSDFSEDTWMRWLDYPSECSSGICVFAPEIAADPDYWLELPVASGDAHTKQISLIRMKNHAYGLLPSLGSMISKHLSHVGEA